MLQSNSETCCVNENPEEDACRDYSREKRSA